MYARVTKSSADLSATLKVHGVDDVYANVEVSITVATGNLKDGPVVTKDAQHALLTRMLAAVRASLEDFGPEDVG